MSAEKNGKENDHGQTKTTVTYHNSEFAYFRAERDKLQSSMGRQLSASKKPERKEYFPDVYNSLEPYGDLEVYNKALDAPIETPHFQYVVRRTASGLCDPWVSYDMDNNFSPPPEPDTARSSSSATKRQNEKTTSGRGSKNDKKTPQKAKPKKDSKQDSKKKTIPLFPTVKATRNEMSGKDLNFSDVPKLRQEVYKTYSSNADRKMKDDYERTKTEFHDRQLDRVSDYHPDSWPSMRASYFAYLQNNPGSARAVRECVRDAESENKNKKDGKARKSTDQNRSSRKEENSRGNESNEFVETDRE